MIALMNGWGPHEQQTCCAFDTARIREEECRDARVEDVRTSVHMAPYSHEQNARLFVFLYFPCFFPHLAFFSF